jgi:small subunit ribosomal protein S17
MASRTLSLPLRAFAGTRPSIQAWRTTRSFATELAPASSTLPIPSSTTPIITPVVDDAQFQTTGLNETDGSTSGKLRPVGVVVSAGKMERTVKVRLPSQKWNNYLRKVTLRPSILSVTNASFTQGNCALTVSLSAGL